MSVLEQPKFLQVIPANSAFFVLEMTSDEDGQPVDVHRQPIVAWAIEEVSYAPYPITLEGVKTGNAHILQPDGTIERPWVDWYPNLEAWLKEQQAEYMKSEGSAA
jgi:hypothetical protein